MPEAGIMANLMLCYRQDVIQSASKTNSKNYAKTCRQVLKKEQGNYLNQNDACALLFDQVQRVA
jgi:hypothetical protein